jgi:hypothetical protein
MTYLGQCGADGSAAFLNVEGPIRVSLSWLRVAGRRVRPYANRDGATHSGTLATVG